jgi:phosphoribosylanthranilate isomerase
MSGKKLTGIVTAEISGREYRLKFGTAAMIQFEDAFDMPLLNLVELLENPETRRINMIVEAFRAGLAQYHPDLTKAEIMALVDDFGLMPTAELVLEAMDAAFPPAPDAKGGADSTANPKRRKPRRKGV